MVDYFLRYGVMQKKNMIFGFKQVLVAEPYAALGKKKTGLQFWQLGVLYCQRIHGVNN